jgi:DNA polymerase III delta subunit
VSKLKSQGTKFTIDNLKLIIENLAKIDIDVKTSKANLVSALDLLIVKYIQ